jgi:elongation factor G
MKEYTTEFLRNVALVAHGSAGKTMLAEAMLHFSGGTTRLGKVEDGTTASDYDDEEIRRKLSLYTSIIPLEYGDVKINLLDAPGFTDFVGEMISALSVADGALVLVDAVAGIEVGTEIAWRYADEFKLPRFVVINKLDRENASFEKAFASVEAFSQTRMVKVQLPIGEKHDFRGVIDLVAMKAYLGNGKTASDIPGELVAAAEDARQALVEVAAEGGGCLEKYLGGVLTDEELVRGLDSDHP